MTAAASPSAQKPPYVAGVAGGPSRPTISTSTGGIASVAASAPPARDRRPDTLAPAARSASRARSSAPRAVVGDGSCQCISRGYIGRVDQSDEHPGLEGPSALLRDVQRGDIILITHRGRVVAEIRSPTIGRRATQGTELSTRRLIEEGTLKPGLPNAPGAYRRSGIAVPDNVVDRALAWNRGPGTAVIVEHTVCGIQRRAPWLLGASDAGRIEHALVIADVVVASVLTRVEVGRVTGQIDASAGTHAWSAYASASPPTAVFYGLEVVLPGPVDRSDRPRERRGPRLRRHARREGRLVPCSS